MVIFVLVVLNYYYMWLNYYMWLTDFLIGTQLLTRGLLTSYIAIGELHGHHSASLLAGSLRGRRGLGQRGCCSLGLGETHR